MGFKVGDFPPVDPATFMDKPLLERVRVLAEHWGEYGFGTPKAVHTTYIVKLIVLYLGVGIAIVTMTSGFTPWDVSTWWNEPIIYQKAVLWTMFLEILGLAGSWGPISGHFKPLMGGALYWARPGTIRNPPWPDKVPFTSGGTRSVFDVFVYAAYAAMTLVAILLPGVDKASLIKFAGTDNGGLVNPTLFVPILILAAILGLRDKVSFLASRPEQYLWVLVFSLSLGFVDAIIAFKLLIVSVWLGAGISKLGHHFNRVVPAMISNTPWLTSTAAKRAMYKDFPSDLRPSWLAKVTAHGGGTFVEIVIPMVLLFTTNATIALLGAIAMVIFHLFILSTFPLAAPLEWNLLFAYVAVFLFVGFPNRDGYGIGDISQPWIAVVIAAALLFFPVLGNLRPDLVSFLPSMRQYAGNWASSMWAMAPGAEEKLDAHMVKPTKMTIGQLTDTYGPEVAEVVMHQLLAWRSLHSQGAAMFTLMGKHLGENINTYSLREAEFSWNAVGAFNFGDAHFHNWRAIESIQARCGFAPGELIVTWIESQPIHKKRQQYQVIDAALGVIERGSYSVAEAVAQRPGIPDGPISLQVDWVLPGHSTDAGATSLSK